MQTTRCVRMMQQATPPPGHQADAAEDNTSSRSGIRHSTADYRLQTTRCVRTTQQTTPLRGRVVEAADDNNHRKRRVTLGGRIFVADDEVRFVDAAEDSTARHRKITRCRQKRGAFQPCSWVKTSPRSFFRDRWRSLYALTLCDLRMWRGEAGTW